MRSLVDVSCAVHRLDDGTEREQVGSFEEFVYREQPGCRVFWGRARLWNRRPERGPGSCY